jgi:hypothetical protein
MKWRGWWLIGLVQISALIPLAVVWLHPTGQFNCTAVVLQFNRDEVTLNTDGTWTIPSWDAVHRMAHSGNSEQECMARELLRRSQEITLNDHPRNDCPVGWYAASRTNPIVKLCSKFEQAHEVPI